MAGGWGALILLLRQWQQKLLLTLPPPLQPAKTHKQNHQNHNPEYQIAHAAPFSARTAFSPPKAKALESA